MGSANGKDDDGGSNYEDDDDYGGSNYEDDDDYGGSNHEVDDDYGGSNHEVDDDDDGSNHEDDDDYGGSNHEVDNDYGGSNHEVDDDYGGSNQEDDDDYGGSNYEDDDDDGGSNYEVDDDYGGSNYEVDNQEKVGLYHYTDEQGAKGIEESGKINESTNKATDATFGQGTYFTDLPPDTPNQEILQNNYDSGSKADDSSLVSHVVKIEVPRDELETDFPKVSGDDRNVYMHEGDVYLDDYNGEVYERS